MQIADTSSSRDVLDARVLASLKLDAHSIEKVARLQSLDRADVVDLTNRLYRLKRECGCHAGAAMLVIGLVAGVALALNGWPDGSPPLVVASVLGIAVTASVLGKLAMIGIARIRWRRGRSRLVATLQRAAVS